MIRVGLHASGRIVVIRLRIERIGTDLPSSKSPSPPNSQSALLWSVHGAIKSLGQRRFV